MKKKVYFLTVGLMVIGLFLAGFLISTNAQEAAGNASNPLFPTFEIPTRPYSTAAETKIPLDEIYAVIDNLEIIDFPDGKVRVKSIGEDTLKYTNGAGRNIVYTFVDGYYYFDITQEQHESQSFYLTFTGGDGFWEIHVDSSHDSVYATFKDKSGNSLIVYETNWYDCEYLRIFYKAQGRIYVEDYYEDGQLTRSEITLREEENEGDVDVVYLPDGSAERVQIYKDHNWFYYYPDSGWDGDIPSGYENYTLQDFTNLVPVIYGCVHHFTEVTCLSAAYCTICSVYNGGPLPHSWVDHDKYRVCAACNLKKYDTPILPEFNFDSVKPKAKLSQLDIPLEEIRSALSSDLDVTYENGMLNIASFEGVNIRIFENDVCKADGNGPILTYSVKEENLADVTIQLHYAIEKIHIYWDYDVNGKLFEYVVELYKDISKDDTYIGYIEEKPAHKYTAIYYRGGENDTYTYLDTYKDGSFCEREVTYYFDIDTEYELEVRYDAKGEIIYIEAESYSGNVYYNFKHQSWSTGRNYFNPVEEPSFAEGKTIDELIERCPSGLDFIQDRDSNVVLTIAVIAGAMIALTGAGVAGFLIGKKKKVN